MSEAKLFCEFPKQLELPRDEIAFREEYEELVKKEELKTIFRPGNRIYPNWRGYIQGEIVTARIIEQIGNDDLFIPPKFKEFKKKVKINKISLIQINQLNEKDFENSSEDVKSINDLKIHLNKIYKKDISEYDNLITKIELEYIDE